jgi:hypothetical protein
MLKKKEEIEALFQAISLDHVEITTDQSYVKPLIKFFKERERRIR